MRIEVFKEVPVRDIDPGVTIRTPKGDRLIVGNVARDGTDFVLSGRPPGRDKGRHVVARYVKDDTVRVVPTEAEEVDLLGAFDPNGTEWNQLTTRGNQTILTAQTKDGWQIEISGPVGVNVRREPVPDGSGPAHPEIKSEG